LLHPSAAVALHAEHEPPKAPHALTVSLVHTPLAQQPVGHEVTSQTHAWLKQRWPAEHAAVDPHWQAPVDEQLSAVTALQAVQADPPTPQLASEAV
jgi:hypothetical protein